MKLIHHSALSSATLGSVWSFASSTAPRVHVTMKRRTDTLHSLYVTPRSVMGFPALTKSRKLFPLILIRLKSSGNYTCRCLDIRSSAFCPHGV